MLFVRPFDPALYVVCREFIAIKRLTQNHASSPGQNGGESKSNGNKTGNNSYKSSFNQRNPLTYLFPMNTLHKSHISTR